MPSASVASVPAIGLAQRLALVWIRGGEHLAAGRVEQARVHVPPAARHVGVGFGRNGARSRARAPRSQDRLNLSLVAHAQRVRRMRQVHSYWPGPYSASAEVVATLCKVCTYGVSANNCDYS